MGILTEQSGGALLQVAGSGHLELIVDDGEPVDLPWSMAVMPLPIGRHSIVARVRFRYRNLGFRTRPLDVDIVDGQVTEVQLLRPLVMGMTGSLQLARTRPLSSTDLVHARIAQADSHSTADAQPPTSDPGWLPDPARLHEHRWFDGQAWTVFVRDGESISTDVY